MYQREIREANIKRVIQPYLWDYRKNQPIQKNATHGVLLAKYEQGGRNYTKGMSKVSTFNEQRKKLCYICNGRLEDHIDGILGLRDPTN